jgi:endonuclease YncB( thermonuclease family)
VSRRPALPPGFTLDDDDNDLPPLPPGFTVDQSAPAPPAQSLDAAPRVSSTPPSSPPRRQLPSLIDAPRKPAAIGTVTGAHDGDTLTTSTGTNVRLFGVDAPELKQFGWDRQGRAVPIGQQSALDLNAALDRARAAVGAPRSVSYGRPVAPVDLGGEDLGQTLARRGDVLAAPNYLRNDPQRRFDYMAAERLARQNGLGIHDTMFQTPENFRHDPQPAPDRDTVAQFWDDPTPLAGMRPEAEKQYLAMVNDPSVDPAKIVTFARENGFAVDPANVLKVREQTRLSGLAAVASYKEAPKILTDSGDGATGAAIRGAGSGALASGLDEIGAFADMFGATGGRENVFNSDRRWADIWQNNQHQNSSILGYDDYAHPYASTAGKIGGGVASAFIVPYGAGARTIPQLASVGGVYGGLEGFLGTDGDLGDRAMGAVKGVPVGAALNAIGGKGLEYGLKYAPRVAERLGVRLPAFGANGAERAAMGEFEGISPPTFDQMAAQAAGRVPDRIDIGAPVPPRQRDVIDIDDVPAPPPGFRVDDPQPALNTAYPGPVAGKPRSLDDIAPDVDAWAREQGIGGNVMLHGSRKPDIEQFDPYQYSNYGLFGQGTYLTDNAGVALSYAGKGAKGATDGRTVYAVEQSVRNPLDLDAQADLAKWARVADQYGLDIQPGMTNERAYQALEDAVAEDRVPKWEGAEIMSDAVRSMGHDGLTHIGGGRYGRGDGASHRVMIALDPEQTNIRGSLDVGAMMRPPMRDRDWIDIGPQAAPRQRDVIDTADYPTLPRGFTIDAQPRVSGNLAMAMDADPGASVSQGLDFGGVRPARMSDPRTMEQMRAVANDVRPSDVLPIPSNQVGNIDEAAGIEAGRYAEAKAPNERGELTKRTIRSWSGAEVPKVGPVDLVGWLRTQGGIMDQGGELAHMGLTNTARRMEFAGQEARFGPLVNNSEGMALDDAAHAAWEAGYFPDHTDRPDVNDFLDAVRDTHEGRNRHFLPEDYAEIDRYRGAQAERYGLEQQRFETGQPVYADKSVPAGDDQPFPPPQAYEEWPAGGPDFAGNINLSKLQSPQDIKRVLDFSHRQVGGFDAATRGRMAWAETERLASEIGMTPERLLQRRMGQPFNAEEALAARQINAKAQNAMVNAAKRLSGIENPSDEALAEFREKWMRAVAIQEQVAGMTAEAGRALQSFRMVADSRAINGDVLARLLDGNGGRKRIQDAAETLVDLVEQGPGKFSQEAARLAKPNWIDKALELRYFNMLSGPRTHVVNMVSNTMHTLGQLPIHGAASAIGMGRRAVMGAERSADRIYPSEVNSRAFGLLQGIKAGGKQFLRTLKTGESTDVVGAVEARTQEAISGTKGKIIRSSSRLLQAEDEMFKTMARNMEMWGLADRQASMEGLKGPAKAERIAEIVANPSDDLLERSFDYARYMTFQAPLKGMPQSIAGFTSPIPRQSWSCRSSGRRRTFSRSVRSTRRALSP